jgi:hypothetical protein
MHPIYIAHSRSAARMTARGEALLQRPVAQFVRNPPKGHSMFGRRSKGFVQLYEYGCRGEPLAGLDAALDQMAGRVRLWNRFVEVEKHLRQGVKALLFDEAEEREIFELKTRIAALRHEIIQTRRIRGQNSPGIRELSELVVRARGALAALMVTVKANRRRRFEQSRPALKILEGERARQAKEAQKQSGLYWCNYDDVRHAYEVARVRVRRGGWICASTDGTAPVGFQCDFRGACPSRPSSPGEAVDSKSIRSRKKPGIRRSAACGENSPGRSYGCELPRPRRTTCQSGSKLGS